MNRARLDRVVLVAEPAHTDRLELFHLLRSRDSDDLELRRRLVVGRL